ncbi:MAG: oligopeptide/dipeptide ABC transporter ATP-binding protein [Candidatus Thorarchaeota archaeon]
MLYSAFSFPNDNIAHKSGKILYWDPNLECYVNLLELQEKEIVKYRGFHFGLIPQLPRESLNPWIQVGIQNGEILKERLKWKKEQARQKVIEFLGKVAISNPKINYRKYVNQMSAGEAQRVCISLALLAMPKIVFADEMFSSLDSLTQAQLIDLVLSLKKDLNMNFVLATHNIGAAGQLCEKIGVIYGGECIEFNDSNNFFKEPLHPYSKLLLESTPWYAVKSGKRLAEIPGEIPDSSNWPSGCKFHPRCPKATSLCAMKKPPRIYFGETFVECFLYAD